MSATSDLLAYKDETISGLERALQAAIHALRSYQFDNASTELAQSVAEHGEAALARSKERQELAYDPRADLRAPFGI